MLDYIRRECRSVIITVDAPGRERVEEEEKNIYPLLKFAINSLLTVV